MLEASIDPKLVARSKKTGKLVYFKSPQHKADALKAGSHEEPKKDKKAQAKQVAKSADLFKGDYDKERGSSGYGSKPGPNYKNPLKSKEDWDDLRSFYGGDVYDADGNVIKNPFETGDDFSDIKGPKPGDSDWSTEDVFNATFKDPETGKEITVGDAYDREDDSPAYEKAFDYVSQFNPDDERVIAGPGSDSQKNTSKVNFPKKASELTYKHTMAISDTLNKELGLDGVADSNTSSMDPDNNTIVYTASAGEEPTYSLYFGPNDDYGKPDEFRVSLDSTYGNDPLKLSGKNDKSFKSAKDAMKYMIALGKKYKKELQMDDGKNESTKLTSMIKK